jgi:hypothetical protein
VGSPKRLARAAPATKLFRLAAIAEQNPNGARQHGLRRLIPRSARSRRSRPPFPENRKRTGQKDRLELGSYRTHIFSIFEERNGKRAFAFFLIDRTMRLES